MPSKPDKVYGPTFSEMRDPSRLPESLRQRAQEARSRPLDPLNLFNIHWKNDQNRIRATLLPQSLTGVEARILVLVGKAFPSGSHKVGPNYAILTEHQLAGKTIPGTHTIICPSTGNFGIGGAWVAPRMGYEALVVLPEEMSQERFEIIRGYGADIVATPGSESNVKEIYDKVKDLLLEPQNRVVQQFADFGNYRFHYEVTGHAVLEAVEELREQGIGNGQVAAFVSAMGSSGTIAAGDLVKQVQPGAQIVGLEPVQCPTLFNVGFGAHKIEGIGDKHVTWIHNVLNTDYLLCIDDLKCLKGLQLVQEGHATLKNELGLSDDELKDLDGTFGVSGICNILGSIQMAKLLNLGSDDVICTVATDGFDRYPSVLRSLDQDIGSMTEEEACKRLKIFHDAEPTHALEGRPEVRQRWHNQKYFTWVEQQGKEIEELNALADSEFWIREQQRIPDIDRAIVDSRTLP